MSEYGSTTIGKETQNLEIADAFDPYSGVRLSVGLDDDGNELVYFSGDETGRVLDVENPFGSQQMADNILASIQGFVYQPMYADGALLDPAAQIGDAVSVNDIYSRICVRATTFGTLMLSDVSSPASEEVVHEYNIPTPEERKFQRLNYDMKSEFKITNQAISAEVSARQSADSALSGRIDVNATAITAKVSKNSPSGQTSFGWALANSEWRVFNQSGNILRATSAGLEVKGKIQADEGYIGGENGFVIKASAIYNGITELNGQGDRGVYLGTDGLQIGQGFIADSYGNVKASNMKLIGGSIEIGVEAPAIDPIIKDNFTFYNWKFEQQSFTEPYFVINEDDYSVTVERATMDGHVSVPASAYAVNGGRITLNSSWLSLQTLGNHTFEFIGEYSNVALTWDYDLTSPTLQIVEAVQRTYFRVDSSGNVTASSLNITGGTISIGDNFFVDAEGNLKASSGVFTGDVYASNIQYGGDAGYFDGAGLSAGTVEGGWGGAIADYTVETGNLVSSITTSLANGESAYDAITNNGYIVVNNVDFRNFPVSWKAVRMADGTTGYAMCR